MSQTVSATLAWAFYAVGGLSATAFTSLYLARVKPWRRRPGEHPAVKRVRRLFLLLGFGTTSLYVRGTAILLTHRAQMPSDWPSLLGTVVSAVILAYVLWLLLTIDDTPGA